MSLVNYDNTQSITGDINSIPDEIIMEWCRYLSLRPRANFARTCNRIARLERGAGERILDNLDFYVYNGMISLVVNVKHLQSWKPEKTSKWLNRALIRDLKITISDGSVEYSSVFMQTLHSLRYQALSANLTAGDDNQHISLLDALLHNRDISDAELTLKWNCAFEERNIRLAKEWLLKMPKTKSLTIIWESSSRPCPVDSTLDDALLYHLSKNTTNLNLSALTGFYTIQEITKIWELFFNTDLRAVQLSASINVAEQLQVLYGAYDNSCFSFNVKKDYYLDNAHITMTSTLEI